MADGIALLPKNLPGLLVQNLIPTPAVLASASWIPRNIHDALTTSRYLRGVRKSDYPEDTGMGDEKRSHLSAIHLNYFPYRKFCASDTGNPYAVSGSSNFSDPRYTFNVGLSYSSIVPIYTVFVLYFISKCILNIDTEKRSRLQFFTNFFLNHRSFHFRSSLAKSSTL